TALDVAWSELALVADLFDDTVKSAVGKGVYLELGLLANFDLAELRFGDVNADVDLIFFQQPRDVLIRRQQIARAYAQDFDRGGGGRLDFAFFQLNLDLFQAGLGLCQLRARVRNLFGTRPGLNQPFSLLRLAELLFGSAYVLLAAAIQKQV